jgi:transglutaminase-like putative cysteine protease
MSAAASVLARAAPRRAEGAVGRWRVPAAALVAFAALALLAGLRFSSLLTHPPALRVLAVVLATTAMGAALALSGAVVQRRGLAAGCRVALLVLGGYLSLRLAGVPAQLLWPWRWPALAHRIARGLEALNGLWPYDGGNPAARMVLLLALAGALIVAAALLFWPSERAARGRKVGALGVLLGLYLTAAVNQRQTGWRLQGLMLLALLCLWGWAWWPRLHDRGRALTWLAIAAVLALAGSGIVRSSGALIDFRDWNPFGQLLPAQSFDWNQTYGPRSWPISNEAMVEVSAVAPGLWRATTLDHFDGVRFMRSPAPPAGTSGLAGVSIERRWIQRATYTVRGLSSAQLLSPGVPLALSSASRTLRRDTRLGPDGSLAVSGAPPASGSRYSVEAYVPQPSVAALRAAPRGVPAAYSAYTALELPGAGRPMFASDPAAAVRIAASPYGGVFALARRLAGGAPGAYELAGRIEAYLRRGFSYDEHPPRRAYPLADFLLRDRSGYCQQFSGAMALLLRMDGVPARVAEGFKAGSRERAGGRFLVTARDAHAWVEVYFAGIGWVAFDPTPASGSAAPAAEPQLAGGLAASGTAANGALARARRGGGLGRGSEKRPVAGAHDGDATLAGALAAALVVVLLAGWWMARRRPRRARAGEAAGALGELAGALRRLGIEVRAETTLAELEARLRRSHGSAAAGYVRMLRERRYAPHADPRRPNARDRRRLRRALCAGRGPIVRLRALRALPPRGSLGEQWRAGLAQRDT